MKVLHINCVYPYGSTGKITSLIHHSLIDRGHESIVLYSRGRKSVERNTQRVCSAISSKINHAISRISGMPYGGCRFQTLYIKKCIEKESPDIVHLQCINGYFVNIYELVDYLKRKKIHTVLTLHAEFMYTANCGCSFDCEKWRKGCGSCPSLFKSTESYFFDRTSQSFQKMKAAFKGFENNLTIIGVSNWLGNRAKESPIMASYNIQTIYNGIDTSIFYKRDSMNFRNSIGVSSDKKLILWVTSGYSTEKGKDFFIRLCERMENEVYHFVIAGADTPVGYRGNAQFLGKIKNQDRLAEIYSAADVMVCCSRQESYPTVCLESQCCGTPVVGFDVGGVSEAILNSMGEVVPLGDIESMCSAVEYWANKKQHITKTQYEESLHLYSCESMTEAYIQLYKGIMGN